MSATHESVEAYQQTRRRERDALSGDERDIYAKLTRRGFVGCTAAATLAALVGYTPRVVRAQQPSTGPRPGATADAVIVLWMAGGMASTETFDPKRYTPFAPGVSVSDVLSTFPAIDTTVDHIKFTAGLEHSRHQYHWHTGYVPPQPMAMPHIGSVVSRTLGRRNPDMPAFVAIGQTVEGAGEIATLKAFHTAGFLGTDHGPFLIVDPQDAASAVRPPKDLGASRFTTGCSPPSRCISTAARCSVRRWCPRSTRPIGCSDRRRPPPSICRSSPRRRSTGITPAASGKAACWPVA
jgi:Protein of unknown function (DUF1501)